MLDNTFYLAHSFWNVETFADVLWGGGSIS